MKSGYCIATTAPNTPHGYIKGLTQSEMTGVYNLDVIVSPECFEFFYL